MILERIPLNLGNYSEFYWKGEGLFVDLKTYSNKDQLLELYGKLKEGYEIEKSDYSFLRSGFFDVYTFFDSIVKNKKQLGDYTTEFLMLLLRTKCFSIDIEDKLLDDTKLCKQLTLELDNFFNIPTILNKKLKVIFPEDFYDEIPQRYSSLVMLYLIALSLNAKRVLKYTEAKEVTCEYLFRDSMFITSFKVEESLEVDKDKLLADLDKDPLARIVANLFSSEYYQNYNQGIYEKDGKAYFWFAWMA